MKLLELPKLDNELIAQQLKTLRLSTDKKITEVAEATGYTPSYISLIENGKRNLNYKILRKILLYGFGETLSSFFAKILDHESKFDTFDEDTSPDLQIYKTPFKLYNEDKTVAIQILIPTDASRGIELVKVILSEGSIFEDEFTTNFKLQGTVLNGMVEIQHNGQRTEVLQNESFSLLVKTTLYQPNSTGGFKILNLSKGTSEILLLFTPPVF
ncbi:MAG: helix-turn-helix domain-containing protein [Candidatus Kryptonium sp.]|nr:helix-turn-helix domain-containing protein [Candidatus Kryptonium sp.]